MAAKKAAAKKKPQGKAKVQTTITPKVERFIQEYLVDLNATRAYMAAFPAAKPASARVQASRLLADPNIGEAIKAAKDQRAQATGITGERVLEELWAIATADTRELMEYHVHCCRHCWGKDHRYQRTASEMERDEEKHSELVEKAIDAGKPHPGEFDPKGGIGYDERKGPNADCPECFGRGVGRTIVHDTRHVSPAAAKLFAGIKETDKGLEIKTHSKDPALDKLAKHLGLYEKDNKQKNPLDGLPHEAAKAILAALKQA